MGEIYHDITSLVAYLAAYGNVTGIQRVEARLLAELARMPGADRSWCVAFDRSGLGYRAWRLTDVFSEGCGGDTRALMRLVEPPTGGRWPSRSQIRRHLNRRGAQGFRRTALKAGLYARALVAPASLAGLSVDAAGQSPEPVMSVDRSDLPRDATLVLMGAGWNDLAVSAAAARHARHGGRVVHGVYDLIPLVRPEYFEADMCRIFRRHMTDVADHAADFMCISRHTQADLQAFLADIGRQIPSTVVPLAHEFSGYPRNARGCRPTDRRLLPWGGPGRRFLLCVGTLEVRKNGLALLEAWLRLRDELGAETPHLVCCGRRGWKVEPFFARLASEPWLRERVHLLCGADDADIAYLHEKSLGSVYPSLYEGWGLPVGEAAWFGRTCITSRESSLPEVCGRLSEYVDPRSPAEIAAAVRQVAIDNDWRAWRERQIAAAPLRTWRDVAADTRAVLAAAPRMRRAA